MSWIVINNPKSPRASRNDRSGKQKRSLKIKKKKVKHLLEQARKHSGTSCLKFYRPEIANILAIVMYVRNRT